jgi:fructokinase
MSSPFTIVSFGEVLWDLLPTGAVLGGAPFNFAYRATTLGHRALIASRLGEDPNGRAAFARIAELGMQTGFIQRDPAHPTGTVPVSFDEKGHHDFTITPDVAYDFIEPEAALLRLAAEADCFCYGTVASRSEVSRSTLKRLLAAYTGTFALLDLNLRKDCWSDSQVVASIEGADILKLNDQELVTVDRIYGLPGGTFTEKAARLVSRTKLRCVVVTLGEGGAFAVSREKETIYEQAFAATPVDTIGSGDAFTAGFIHALLSRRPLAEALRLGNALGALVTGQRGATEPLGPGRIEAMLADGKRLPRDPRLS